MSSVKIFIQLIIVFDQWKRSLPQSLNNDKWSNLMQDLSLKIQPSKTIEIHPLHEGFMLLPDENKKLFQNRTLSSTTTTCKTVVIVTTTKRTTSSSPLSPLPKTLDHSVGHLGRRLLNEPSYDTDLQKQIDDDWKMNDFMNIDTEELSKDLSRLLTNVDGSGETTEETTKQTSVSTSTTTTTTTYSTTIPTVSPEHPNLSNESNFILTVNCSNANQTLNEILSELTTNFGPYVLLDRSEPQCNSSEPVNVTLNIGTSNDIPILNNLFDNLSNIAKAKGVDVYSNNKCGNNGIQPVINVTSCFLIELCQLCGNNPPRGVCIPAYKETKCECLPNKNDSSRPYTGDFCLPSDSQPTASSSNPSRYTPIIVGVLAGLAGLFGVLTACLWTITLLGKLPKPNYSPQISRFWHLPRVQLPTNVTVSNEPTSPSPSNQSDSDNSPSTNSDNTFFKELDQRMGENLRSTITRPNSSALLASLPTDTLPTLTNYDPIDELDSIIDNEDINDTMEPLEAINPLFK